MKELHFIYSFSIDYNSHATRSCFTIKGIPEDSRRQKIRIRNIQLLPDARISYGSDAFGNTYIWGHQNSCHSMFCFCIEGSAECGLADYEAEVTERERMLFRHPTKLTAAGEKIREFQKTLEKEREGRSFATARELVWFLMERLYDTMQYEKETTDIATTAEEAFCEKKGVCQDYAQILIALLHLEKIPARYVTGFLQGEGESHAWVEFEDRGKWIGIDPTNRMMVTDSHIRVGVGRDSSECQMNRGIVYGGGGDQVMKTAVTVTEPEKA